MTILHTLSYNWETCVWIATPINFTRDPYAIAFMLDGCTEREAREDAARLKTILIN